MASSTDEISHLREKILHAFDEVFQTRGIGDTPKLSDESILLETGLDSLGFAILVTLLDETLGYDPFTLSDDAYYPQTLEDFVKFYHQNKPE